MSTNAIKESLPGKEPPANLSIHLTALWHAAKGEWDKAHGLVQDLEDKDAAWIHAYLHRQEGDLFNADYWYRRAAKKRPATSLEHEWETIVESLS